MLGKLGEGPGTCVRLWFCRQLIFLMFLSFKLLGVWRMDWKKRRHQRKCKLIYFASNTRFIIFLSWFCPCHITDSQLLNLAAILYPSLPILLLSTLCSGLQNSRFLICSPARPPLPAPRPIFIWLRLFYWCFCLQSVVSSDHLWLCY